MNGYQVARALHDDPEMRDARLVALSGYARPEDRERSAAAEFDEHLAKPPSVEAIESILAEPARR
jgi:CheY-like chemotaxis protein